MKAGAVEFLTKPFKDDVLLDAIRGAVERSRTAFRSHLPILSSAVSTSIRSALAKIPYVGIDRHDRPIDLRSR
jgi:FixJ family two-component response regulator